MFSVFKGSKSSSASNTSDEQRELRGTGAAPTSASKNVFGRRRGSGMGDDMFSQDDAVYEERERHFRVTEEALQDLLAKFDQHRNAMNALVGSARELSGAVANLYSSRHPYYEVALRYQKATQDTCDIIATRWEKEMQSDVEAGLREKLADFPDVSQYSEKRKGAKDEVLRRTKKLNVAMVTEPTKVRDNERRLREAKANYRVLHEEVSHRINNLELGVEKLIFPMVKSLVKLNASVSREVATTLEEMVQFAEEYSPADRLFSSGLSDRGSSGSSKQISAVLGDLGIGQKQPTVHIEEWDGDDFDFDDDVAPGDVPAPPESTKVQNEGDATPGSSKQVESSSPFAERPRDGVERPTSLAGRDIITEKLVHSSCTSPSKPPSIPVLARVRASHNYKPEGPHEVALRKGQIIEVMYKDPSGWWQGSAGGTIGFFPGNFTCPLTDDEETAFLVASRKEPCFDEPFRRKSESDAAKR